MSFASFLGTWFRRRSRFANPKQQRAARRCLRVRLELLEDRCLPGDVLFTGLGLLHLPTSATDSEVNFDSEAFAGASDNPLGSAAFPDTAIDPAAELGVVDLETAKAALASISPSAPETASPGSDDPGSSSAILAVFDPAAALFQQTSSSQVSAAGALPSHPASEAAPGGGAPTVVAAGAPAVSSSTPASVSPHGGGFSGPGPQALSASADSTAPGAPPGDGENANPPRVTLEAPATAAGNEFTAKVTATADGAGGVLPYFGIDVDLNHDNRFDGPGETDYAIGNLDENGTGTAQVGGLIHSTYKVRAWAFDVFGTQGFSSTTSVQLTQPAASRPISFELNKGQTDASVQFLGRSRHYSMFLTPQEVVLTMRDRSVPGEGGKADLLPPAPLVQRISFVGANPNPAVVGEQLLPGVSHYFLGEDPSQWVTDVSTYAQVRYQDLYPGVDLLHKSEGGRLRYDFIVSPGADVALIGLELSGVGKAVVGANGELQLYMPDGLLVQTAPVVYQEMSGGGTVAIRSRYVLRGFNEVGFEVGPYDPTRPLIIDPTLAYSTYLGGNSDDSGDAIAVDSSGNAYVTGIAFSSDFPTQDPFQSSRSGTQDAFVTKLNTTGTAVVYSTYLGGSSTDAGRGIAVDSSGSAYVTGETDSTNFPTTTGVVQTTSGGGTDPFATKLTAAGSALSYSTYLGGSGTDIGRAITVDASGNAYVGGETGSTNFPTTTGVVQTASGGNTDGFAVKLNGTATTRTYSTYLGGSSNDIVRGLALDSSTNLYVTGTTDSTNYATTTGVFQTTKGSGTDAFVTKLNTDATARTYSTYLGGNGNDNGRGIEVDGSGNAYITGSTASTDIGTSGAFRTTLAGGTDAFVAKINSDATSRLYTTYLGGSGTDDARGIAVDTSGNAYVAGSTTSTNYPTQDPLANTRGTGEDVIVTIVNSAGSGLIFSTYIGGSSSDDARGIAIDSNNNMYVTGATLSTNFPTTTGAFQTGDSSGVDGFVLKIDPRVTPPPPPPPPGPGPAPVPLVPADPLEPNNTSDAASDLGTLTGSRQINNLSINQLPGGLFDRDWYRFAAGVSGTFTVTLSSIASNGDLHVRVFRRNADSTLTEIASSTTTGGVTTQQASVAVSSGQSIYVWVFGFNFAVGTYNMTLGIA